jgi:hypothetical protein
MLYVSSFLYWFFAVRRYKRNRGGHKEQSKEGRGRCEEGEEYKIHRKRRGRKGRGLRRRSGKERKRGSRSEWRERHHRETGNEKREGKK